MLNVATALTSFSAAAFWFWSTIACVKPEPDKPGQWNEMQILTDDGACDFFLTLKLQASLNRWAAGSAAVAALLQAIVATLGSFSTSN